MLELVGNHGHALKVVYKAGSLLALHIELDIHVQRRSGHIVHARMVGFAMALDGFCHGVHRPAVVTAHIAVVLGYLLPGIVHMLIGTFYVDP